MPVIRILTTGSLWLIDEDLQRYLRMPKQEGPRTDEFGNARPEWGDQPGAGKDGEWHPYDRWLYVSSGADAVQLVIEYPASSCSAELRGQECLGLHFIRSGRVVDAEGTNLVPDEEIDLSVDEHEFLYWAAASDG